MEELLVSQDVLRASVHRSGPPTCISNDNAHEMIHVGWNNGGISVYRPIVTHEVTDMIHWTSFPAHRSTVFETYGSYGAGIYSISAKAFKVHTHGGAEIFSQDAPARGGASSVSSPPHSTADEFRCFTFCSATRAVLGMQSGRVWEIDLQYGRLLNSNVADDGLQQEIAKVRMNDRGAAVFGTTQGTVAVWDYRTKKMTSEFKGTTGGKISDMDVSGDLAVTCGYSSKGAREPFLRVFDIRTQRQLPPIQFLTPVGLRFVPSPYIAGGASSNVLVVSANGNIRLTDIRGTGATDSFGRVQSGSGNIEAVAVSSTGRSFSLVDATGHIHLWSTNVNNGWDICDPQILQNQPFPEIEHPQPAEIGPTSLIHYNYWINDDPCASYPMPFIEEGTRLLSDFPPHVLDRPLRLTKASLKINPGLLAKVNERDGVGYITNTAALPGSTLLFGKEHHDKAYVDVDPREPYVPKMTRGRSDSSSDAEDAEPLEGESEEVKKDAMDIRRRYGRQNATATQVTISEHDFGEVNATQFAGLEVDHDPNAFVNAPLQALYFLPEFRAGVLSQPFSNKAVCIPTETNMLFRLLDMTRKLPSKDKACQAKNFQRAFRLSPDALALGLLEPSKMPNDRRAGAFVRFLFTQFLAGGIKEAKENVETLFGAKLSVRDSYELNGKKHSSSRDIWSLVVDVLDDERAKRFEETLAQSLRQEKKHRTWSDEVKTYVNVTTVKSPVSMPPYLVVNCADMIRRKDTGEDRYFCESFAYQVDKSKLISMRDANASIPENAEIYDIVGVVSRITDIDKRAKSLLASMNKTTAKSESSSSSGAVKSPPPPPLTSDEESQLFDGHLVAHIKLQSEYDQVDDDLYGRVVAPGSWMLFNDICVSQSNLSEVLNFSSRFRAPAVVIYKKRLPASKLPPVLPRFQVSPEVFLTPSIASSAKKNKNSQQTLGIPQVNARDLIAIDCEFVALTNDVYEVKPDGTKIVIAPRQLALARVSCLSAEGKVIMDDYVASGPEPVADYLTRFSGLMPGDLDPAVSTKHLLPHRVVYNKLLYLIEKGCIFIGHGLNSDFRVVNILVPPPQLRDTVELFWVKGQRKFSLRFLSSVLLQEDIQDRVHDSIQDARAALKLYQMYVELEKNKKLEETLKRLYLEGPMRNWS